MMSMRLVHLSGGGILTSFAKYLSTSAARSPTRPAKMRWTSFVINISPKLLSLKIAGIASYSGLQLMFLPLASP